MLQLFHRSGAATGDLAHLTGRPTTNRTQDHHFALVIRQLVEETDQIVQSDHGDGLRFDVNAGRDNVVAGVDGILLTSRPTSYLIDTTRPGDGEHPRPETSGVAPKVAYAPSHLEEDLPENVLGIGHATGTEKPENLWSEPAIEGVPCTLVSGTRGAEMCAKVTVLHGLRTRMLIAGTDRAA